LRVASFPSFFPFPPHSDPEYPLLLFFPTFLGVGLPSLLFFLPSTVPFFLPSISFFFLATKKSSRLPPFFPNGSKPPFLSSVDANFPLQRLETDIPLFSFLPRLHERDDPFFPFFLYWPLFRWPELPPFPLFSFCA